MFLAPLSQPDIYTYHTPLAVFNRNIYPKYHFILLTFLVCHHRCVVYHTTQTPHKLYGVSAYKQCSHTSKHRSCLGGGGGWYYSHRSFLHLNSHIESRTELSINPAIETILFPVSVKIIDRKFSQKTLQKHFKKQSFLLQIGGRCSPSRAFFTITRLTQKRKYTIKHICVNSILTPVF